MLCSMHSHADDCHAWSALPECRPNPLSSAHVTLAVGATRMLSSLKRMSDEVHAYCSKALPRDSYQEVQEAVQERQGLSDNGI